MHQSLLDKRKTKKKNLMPSANSCDSDAAASVDFLRRNHILSISVLSTNLKMFIIIEILNYKFYKNVTLVKNKDF